MKNNYVFLSGMVPEDATLGETKDGTLRCMFKISVPKSGTEQGILEFALFGLSAKAWHPHLKKDTPLTIIGHLDQTVRMYEGKIFANLYLAIDDIQLQPPVSEDSEHISFDDEDPTLVEMEALGL